MGVSKAPGLIRSFRRVLAAAAMAACALSAAAHDGDSALPIPQLGRLAPAGDGAGYTSVWGFGNIALLGSSADGVSIISLTDLSSPSVITTYEPSLGFKDVRVFDQLGCFTTTTGVVHLVDLTTPSSPTLVSMIDGSNGGLTDASAAWIEGSTFYQVSDQQSFIRVFDLTTRSTPLFVRDTATDETGGLADVVVADGMLYAAGRLGIGGEGAAYIFDVSGANQTDPQIDIALATGFETGSLAVTSDGSRLVTAERAQGGQIRLFDLRTYFEIGHGVASDYNISAFSPAQVFMFDDLAYVSWHQGGLQVVDPFNLAVDFHITRVAYFETTDASPLTGFVGNVDTYAGLGIDRILVADSDFGLYVVDGYVLLSDCSPDFARPYGVLDVFDVIEFLGLWSFADPLADVASPFGVFDVFDVIEYLGSFELGCE